MHELSVLLCFSCLTTIAGRCRPKDPTFPESDIKTLVVSLNIVCRGYIYSYRWGDTGYSLYLGVLYIAEYMCVHINDVHIPVLCL